MKLYNTLSRKTEDIKPLINNTVRMYACGPTVYDHAHIGNLRTYINEDILRRTLELDGFRVKEVMNITDIEDKIIKKAHEDKVDYKVITEKYEKLFLEDMKSLNIQIPEHMPRATEEIDSMITLIQGLLDKGIAYKSDDGGIYFSISKYNDYGKLAHIDFTGLKEGARVDHDEYDKENAKDFVLWKATKEGEPMWEAPFGKGRPGWHIECSAMSMKYLGEQIDLHAGAVDLIFPHHENEIAQSEAITGKEFVKYWFHPEHLMVEGKKMSKSLGNIYTLEEVCNKYQVEPLAFRMLCLSSYYREKLNFTSDSIIQAQNTLNNLRDFVSKVQQYDAPIDKDTKVLIDNTLHAFRESLNDDMNTPRALANIFDMIKSLNKSFVQTNTFLGTEEIVYFFQNIDKVLAINIDKASVIPQNVKDLFEKYQISRSKKDYDESDKLRDQMKKLGYITEDYEGTSHLRAI
jgi:cysteinyl-tRNA synthetase